MYQAISKYISFNDTLAPCIFNKIRQIVHGNDKQERGQGVLLSNTSGCLNVSSLLSINDDSVTDCEHTSIYPIYPLIFESFLSEHMNEEIPIWLIERLFNLQCLSIYYISRSP